MAAIRGYDHDVRISFNKLGSMIAVRREATIRASRLV
jgi:hypothetical protein